MRILTTMDVDKLSSISKIETPANNFSFNFKNILSSFDVYADIKEFTNKKHDALHIQLICEEKYQADKVDIAMIKLQQYYSFKWGYVSEIDNSLVKNIPVRNLVINIDVFDIKNRVA